MDIRVSKAPFHLPEMPVIDTPPPSRSRSAPPRPQREGQQESLPLENRHFKIGALKPHALNQAHVFLAISPKGGLTQKISLHREVYRSHSESAVVDSIAQDLHIAPQQAKALVRQMTTAMGALSATSKLRAQTPSALTTQERNFLAHMSGNLRETLANILRYGPLLCAMTFGGSRVRGNFRENSDLDIGVEVFQDPDGRPHFELKKFMEARRELEAVLLTELLACGTEKVPVESGIRIQPGYKSNNISTIHDPAEFFLRSGRRTSPLREGEGAKPSFSSSGAHSYFFDGAGCYGRIQFKGDHPNSGIYDELRLLYPRDQREAYQKHFPCI